MQITTISQDITAEPIKIGLFSDLHIDSIDCDREKLKDDLDFCLKNDIMVFFNGDVFSCILPTDRKRFVRSQSMFNSDAQINEIVNYVFEFLKPYSKIIKVVGLGNHETSVIKFNNYNPAQSLADKINDNGGDCKLSGYKDFIRLKLSVHDTRFSYDILKFHGAGGSSPVTKGIIDFNRLSTCYSADLYWTGHKHTAMVNNSMPLVYVDHLSRICEKPRLGVITPGYQKPVEESDRFNLSYSEQNFCGVSATPGFCLLTIQKLKKYPSKTYTIQSKAVIIQ